MTAEFCSKHESLPYFISSSLVGFDFVRVQQWISNSYWAKGISMELVIKSFTNSLSFGLFHQDEGQVGCARMITDKATFAYLGDVFIAENHRGRGLGDWLMEVILAHPELQGLRRMMLATSDMHSLYAKFGFKAPAKPEILMEKLDPKIARVLYEEE